MARLTTEQRNLLDKVLEEHIEDYVGKIFTYNQLANDLLEYMGNCGVTSLAPQNVTSSMKRVLSDEYIIGKSRYSTRTNVYTLKKIALTIQNNYTECVKDKNILIITNSYIGETGECLSYNFATQKFNIDIDNYSRDNVKGYNALLRLKETLKYEWLWNYTTNVYELSNICNSYFLKEYIETMPKGYSKYLMETNQDMTYRNLKEYIFISLYGKFGYNLYKEYDVTEEELNDIHNTIGLDTIKKIMVSGAKNGESIIRIPDLISNIVKLVSLTSKENILNILDTNRGVDKNRAILKDILNNHKKEFLEKQLKKLNCINGFEIKDYVVVVPQTVEEKADEGKQQNNCVGSYYDDSIISGKNLIYFVRKKENPSKSYITCRYDTNIKSTVECRYKNNRWVNSTDEKIINEITKVINERL